VGTNRSRFRRIAVGLIATLTLAGVGASTATAATTLSAQGTHVSADWTGHK
jgi:hypothetical protein